MSNDNSEADMDYLRDIERRQVQQANEEAEYIPIDWWSVMLGAFLMFCGILMCLAALVLKDMWIASDAPATIQHQQRYGKYDMDLKNLKKSAPLTEEEKRAVDELVKTLKKGTR